jgi:hypothetical protein
MYTERAPTRPSLQELMWRLREGALFKNLMKTETPPSSVAMSTSDHTVHEAVVALSALLRAIDEHGPYRIPFDLDQLADLRRILDRDVNTVAVRDWLRTFCRPIVCMLPFYQITQQVVKSESIYCFVFLIFVSPQNI